MIFNYTGVAMKLHKRFLLYCGLLLLASLFAHAQAANNPPSSSPWTLVWSDEFNGPDGSAPDSSKWVLETGGGGWGNNELEYYTVRPQNASLHDGNLVIKAIREKYTGADGVTRDYTSARLKTQGKFAQGYGRFEARIKIPRGQGIWPAFWMLGNDIDKAGWPTCGEIDIMEFVGFDPGVIHANVHTEKYNHVKKTNKGDQITVADASDAFHVYAIEWDAEKIDFFVDGRKYFTFRNEKSGRDAWPYDREQFVILNLAIGGDWGGQKGIDDRIFPQRLVVDYVRVYRRSQGKD
jgi:beta-glucanase (GH16 family)